jgi:hypothetical protein
MKYSSSSWCSLQLQDQASSGDECGRSNEDSSVTERIWQRPTDLKLGKRKIHQNDIVAHECFVVYIVAFFSVLSSAQRFIFRFI